MRNSRSHNANFNSFFSLEVYILLSSKKKEFEFEINIARWKKKFIMKDYFRIFFLFGQKERKFWLLFFLVFYSFINILLLSHIIWYTPSIWSTKKKLPYPFLITIIFIQIYSWSMSKHLEFLHRIIHRWFIIII